MPSVTATTTVASMFWPPPCLPEGPIPVIDEPVWLYDVLDEAKLSGNLPAEGLASRASLSFDQRFLFVEWMYAPLEDPFDVSLLRYDLQDGSVHKLVERLTSNAIPSPASDCILLFGALEGEDPESFHAYGLKVIDSAGRRHKFVVQGGPQPSHGASIAWSADGLHLAYTDGSHALDSLYITDADGHGARALSRSSYGDYFNVQWLAWSPTGEQIAVDARYMRPNGTINVGMFLVNVETGQQEMVVESMLGPTFWSSDGRSVVFEGYDGCHMLDLQTREQAEVPNTWCYHDPRPGTRP